MEIKYARVVPLYKDGDKKCMVNYRPISVLPVASKILERAVQIQLLQHLDKSSQLSPFQCGFRKNHSTQDAVTYFTDCIRKGIDEGCVTAPVFVDCLWQRTVCTSADKIWRPTRIHTWSDFVFDLHQWLTQLFTSVKDPTLWGWCCPFLRWLQYRSHT